MNDNKRISIKEIARLADTSIATVSRIINKKGGYSKETERLVNDIIDTYGYVSNMAAKSLRESKSHTIGIIVPDISNDFFATIALHVEKTLKQHNYSCYICNTSNDEETEKEYFKDLDSKLVDGIICISGLKNLPENISNRNIPIVCIDRKPANSKNIPIVSNNDTEASYEATKLLIEKGCKQIIYISAFPLEHHLQARRQGYEKALLDHNIKLDKNLIFYLTGKDISYVESEVLVAEFLQAGNTCDGILATSDRIALGALYALKRYDIKIPEEVKLIGFDNSLYSRLPSPSISTISRNTVMLASEGCRILLDMLDGKTPENLETIVPAYIVERESTK